MKFVVAVIVILIAIALPSFISIPTSVSAESSLCSGKISGTTTLGNVDAGCTYFDSHQGSGVSGAKGLAPLKIVGIDEDGYAPASLDDAACVATLDADIYEIRGYAWNEVFGCLKLHNGVASGDVCQVPHSGATGSPKLSSSAFVSGAAILPRVGHVPTESTRAPGPRLLGPLHALAPSAPIPAIIVLIPIVAATLPRTILIASLRDIGLPEVLCSSDAEVLSTGPEGLIMCIISG